MPEGLHLSPRHREAIEALLRAHLPDVEVWAYGSRVNGRSHDGSDLDLVLRGLDLKEIPIGRLGDFEEAVRESSIPFLVEVRDWTRLPERFHHEIKRHHVVLMAGDWRIMSLREAGVSLFDCEHRTPPAQEHGYPYVGIPQVKNGRIDLEGVRQITSEHYDEWTQKAKPEPFDVVLSRRCNPGETGFVANGLEFALGQNLVLLRADETKIIKPFLRWLVRGPQWWEQVGKYINVGAVFDSLKCADIPEFQLPIPPIPEQRAIAHILGTLDDKIELNRRMNAPLEAMARALFRSWFVDFDPVKAKMEGRDTGLPKDLADLFPDRLADSELGEIPEGWNVATLGDISEVIDCLHSKKPDRTPEGKPLLQLWNIQDNGLTDMSDTYFIDEGDYERWTSRIEVRKGDCVITNVGRVGAVSQIPPGLHAALGRNMTAVRCITGFGYPTFVIAALLSDAMRWEIALKTDSGTILNALNVRSIPKLRFVRAPELVLAAHERIARPMRARMEANLETSRTLAALRDKLLPKLVSGELRIPGQGPAWGHEDRSATGGAHEA